MSHTNRWLRPLPRAKRFICEGSIRRAAVVPGPGAVAMAISASVSACTAIRSPRGTYNAYGAAPSKTSRRSPISFHRVPPCSTLTVPPSTTTHTSRPVRSNVAESPGARRCAENPT